jgi:methyl-accepting chemotaxis protein
MQHSEAAAPAALRRREPPAARWLARLRIGPKLLLAPALVLALLAVSSSSAYFAMQRQNQSLDMIVQVRAARIRDATELVAEAQAAHARSYQLLTWISASVSAARVQVLEDDIHRRHTALARRFAQLAARALQGSVERRLLEQAQMAHAQHVRAVIEVIELAGGDQSVAANAMVKAEQAFEREALRLAALAAHERRESEAAARRAGAEFGLMRLLMPALVAFSMLLSVFITGAVRRALLREVRGIGASARALAGGNLTVPERDYGGDEISDTSRTLDESIRSLNGTLREILESARALDSASRGVVDGNAQLGDGSVCGAGALRPTRATIDQLSATMRHNASHAEAASRLAASASQQSAAAASQIRALMAQGMGQIDAGSVAASEAMCSMAELAQTVRLVGNMVSEICAASAQQVSEISQVNCVIVQLDHVTQQNAAAVARAAAAAASLQAQAFKLSQAVAVFRLDEGEAGEGGKPRLWLASKRE